MHAIDQKTLALDQKFKKELVISCVIAAAITIASVTSLVFRHQIYPSEELVRSFIANDIANVLIGIPGMLLALRMVRSNKLLGLLLWPGALFYGMYNYLVYLLSMPFSVVYPLYIIIILLSAIVLFRLLTRADGEAVKEEVGEEIPAKVFSGIMVFFGISFSTLAVIQISSYLIGQADLSSPEIALNITDFLFSLVWIICGTAFWQRKPFGYLTALGMLYLGCTLFAGLIIVLILQPWITSEPLAVFDLALLVVMSLIVVLPFRIFIRVLRNKDRA